MRYHEPGWSLQVHVERIDVTVGRATPSETWRAVDSNGHEHYYARGYPTLNLVVDEQHWCDGNEGYAHHDPHMQVDAAHYECTICGETIEPATDPPFTPKTVPGARTATITGVRSDGVRVEAVLTADELDRLQTADMSDAAALAILDDLPMDRLTAFSVEL